MKNQHKQGNFDCIFSSKQDAIKFIKHGTGKIKERSFFMRMSKIINPRLPKLPKQRVQTRRQYEKQIGLTK